MRFFKSFWMTAMMSAGLWGAGSVTEAASNPNSSSVRVNCATPACANLNGSFAGRLEWWSGNVQLFSEAGSFTRLSNGDVLVTLSGNGNAQTFQSTYVDANTSVLTAPDLNYKLFSTQGGDTLLQAATYRPVASALVAKVSEDAQAEAARALAAENVLSKAISAEISNRSSADQQLTGQINQFNGSISSLQTALDAEIAARKAGDMSLQTSVSQLNMTVSVLQMSLTSEIMSRQTGDATLQSQINNLTNNLNAEITNRSSADQNIQNALNNEINRAQNAEAAAVNNAVTQAQNYTNSRTPWPQSCAAGEIIEATGPGTWKCAPKPVGGGGGGAGFPSSTIISANEGTQINTWANTPNQLWKMCWSRNVHGANSNTFHQLCDNKGPSVWTAKMNNGVRIGGYTAQNWNQNANNYVADTNAFLFSLTNNFKHIINPNYFGANNPYAIYGGNGHGTTMGGGHDFYVPTNMTNGGYCNIGYSYQCRVGNPQQGNQVACQNDFCGSYSSWSITEYEVWIKDGGGGGNGSCLNNPQWQAVNCSTTEWVWSSNRSYTSVQAANTNRTLWAGCAHSNAPNTCSLDGTGWVSTQVFTMSGCNSDWWHIGGRYTGACGGHDGDQVRRLALGPNDCYAY